MFHYMTGVGCDLVIGIIITHEMNGIPMILSEAYVLLLGKVSGYIFIPILGIDKITFFVNGG